MPRVSAPINAEKNFERSRHDREIVEVLLKVGDEYGAAIVGAEVMVTSEDATHDARELLVILPLVIHEQTGDILRVVEVAHGAEGDHDHGVVVVVSALDLVLINADDLKGDAIDSDVLSDRRLTGK